MLTKQQSSLVRRIISQATDDLSADLLAQYCIKNVSQHKAVLRQQPYKMVFNWYAQEPTRWNLVVIEKAKIYQFFDR